mgnify:CR=1 FL=1
MAGSNEFPFQAVPSSERRGPIVMGLLWITMVTAFPTVLAGFQWYKDGFTLWQVVGCCLLSCLMLLAYVIPSAQMGARTGQTYTGLSRTVFGKWGSRLVTVNLIWMFVAFYGLTALFMAEAIQDSFHLHGSLMWLTAAFAVLMAFNNFFGFKGVANFARYFAAPVLICWMLYTFFKAVTSCPDAILFQPSHKPFTLALSTISSFVIGFAVWGNEADYWRFSKPQLKSTVPPLAIALALGMVMFPVTGWILAKLTGITDYAAATTVMSTYSFGGVALIGVIVLGASYFACNDSNLFGSAYAFENLKKLSHKSCVCIIAVLGAIVGVWLALSGSAKSLEMIASLNAVILPTPTVIMICEWALCNLVFRTLGRFGERIPEFDELPSVRLPATIALFVAIGTGLATSGVIPGTESMKVGIPSVLTWLVSAAVYIPLRMIEYRQTVKDQRVVLENVFSRGAAVEVSDR